MRVLCGADHSLSATPFWPASCPNPLTGQPSRFRLACCCPGRPLPSISPAHRVEMTPLQRQYYRWILSRNFHELNKGVRSGGGHVSLSNIIMELKKACNHPFLFESAEEEYRLADEDASALDRLTRTSGKMVLLDKLLTRLKASGHRVLLFSQVRARRTHARMHVRMRARSRNFTLDLTTTRGLRCLSSPKPPAHPHMAKCLHVWMLPLPPWPACPRHADGARAGHHQRLHAP